MAGIVLEEVEEWIKNDHQIQWIHGVNRGWERWAQLDFYLNLRNKGIQASVEDACYTVPGFCDISTSPLIDLFGNVTTPGAVLELKVLNGQDTATQYAAKLLADFTKLQTGLNANFQNHQRCSYGIAPAATLIIRLNEKHRGAGHGHDPTTEPQFSAWMNEDFPHHHYETVRSARGEYFVISFINLDA
jgi:hypothetical protein